MPKIAAVRLMSGFVALDFADHWGFLLPGHAQVGQAEDQGGREECFHTWEMKGFRDPT
jgi:hypothetical protein